MRLIRSSIAVVAAAALWSGAQAATLFMGAYPNSLITFDESKGTVTGSITLASGLPRAMALSQDKSKIFVNTGTADGIEVVDVATRKVLTQFRLDTPRTRFRFTGGAPDPTGKFYYTTLVQIDKGIDRYKVSKPRYAVISLEQQKVIRSRDVDEEDEQASANAFRSSSVVSEDGKLLYVFRDKVIVLNTADLKVVDRIDLAKPEVSDLQAATFGPAIETIAKPGQYVSLFDAADPYTHNRLFGIGRFNLATHEFSFTPIGPAPATMAGLQVAPDAKTAYTVVTNGTLGNKRCEFWRFDLQSNEVQGKSEFPCRSRFSLGMSANGQKLYIYGASYDIEVYDAKTLKHERTWDLNHDITGAGMIVGR